MPGIFFIAEGQTEEKFLQNALIPYLQQKCANDFSYGHLNLGGGIHLPKLIGCIVGKSYNYDYVTTLIDLARLHNARFDNYNDIMKQDISSSAKARLLESQLSAQIPAPLQAKFIPHVQPYEFEALCFGDLEGLAAADPKIAKNLGKIKNELRDGSSAFNAELINNNHLPSKRLLKYGYFKESTLFAQYCNIDTIRGNCPHFSIWLYNLAEKLLR